MTAARLVMAVATACLARERDGWARAMEAELAAIEGERRSLAFALGCLFAAWRELPLFESGRFLLSRYGLALGVALPFATFHLGCGVTAARFLLTGHDPYVATLAAGDEHHRAMAAAYGSAAPALTLLLVSLGVGHLLVAWHVVACRWRRTAMAMTLAALAAITLVACIIAIEPSGRGIVLQLAALAVELMAVPALRAWHAGLNGGRSAARPI